MSKIEAGRIRLDREPIELEPFLDDAMRVVSGRANDKKLALTARIDSGIRLHADRRLLKQIVLNLLSNAVKFTPEGGRVTVRAPRRRGIRQHRHRGHRHRHSARRARQARPAVRAGRKPAHQEPSGFRAWTGHRAFAHRAARRRDPHPLDAGARHRGAVAAAGSDRAVRPRRGRDGGGLTSERTVRTALVNCCTVTLVRADAWIMSAGRSAARPCGPLERGAIFPPIHPS